MAASAAPTSIVTTMAASGRSECEPMILGHEISGHVAALGAGVAGLQSGALVASIRRDPAAIAAPAAEASRSAASSCFRRDWRARSGGHRHPLEALAFARSLGATIRSTSRSGRMRWPATRPTRAIRRRLRGRRPVADHRRGTARDTAARHHRARRPGHRRRTANLDHRRQGTGAARRLPLRRRVHWFGRMDVAPLLSATLPVTDANDVFLLAGDKSRAIKVQIAFA